MQVNIGTDVNNAIKSNNWKSIGILGFTCLVIVALLNSFLFTIILSLLKLGLAVIGIGLLCWSAYLAYPVLSKKYSKS